MVLIVSPYSSSTRNFRSRERDRLNVSLNGLWFFFSFFLSTLLFYLSDYEFVLMYKRICASFSSFFFEGKKKERILFLEKIIRKPRMAIGRPVPVTSHCPNDIVPRQDRETLERKISLSALKFLKRDYAIVFTRRN